MKKLITILLLAISGIASAQDYQLNYPSIRAGNLNSKFSFRGNNIRMPYIPLGSDADSVMVIDGGVIKKVPRSQFNIVQNSLSPNSTTLAPSVTAVNGGLNLKIDKITENNELNKYYLSGSVPTYSAEYNAQENNLIKLGGDTLMMIFRRSILQQEQGASQIVKMLSYDNGLKWQAPAVIYQATNIDSRNLAAGMIGNNIAVWFRRNSSNVFQDFGYIYSTNRGSTFSAYQMQTSQPGLELTPFGNIVKCTNNTLFAVFYHDTDNYIEGWRSSDGVTWARQTPAIEDVRTTNPSLRLAEPYIESLGQNRLIMIIRDNNSSPGSFYQKTSSDNGVTWTSIARSNVYGGYKATGPGVMADTTRNLLIVGYGIRHFAADDTRKDSLAYAFNTISGAISSPTSYNVKLAIKRPSPSGMAIYGYPSFAKIGNGKYISVFSDRVNLNTTKSEIGRLWQLDINYKNSSKNVADSVRYSGLTPQINIYTGNLDYLSTNNIAEWNFNPGDSTLRNRSNASIVIVSPKIDSVALRIVSNQSSGNTIPIDRFRFISKSLPRFVIGDITDDGVSSIQSYGSILGKTELLSDSTNKMASTRYVRQSIKNYVSTDNLATVVSRGGNNVGNIGLNGIALSGGGAASWLTLNGTSTYSGGLIYSLNGIAKGYNYIDNNDISISGNSGVGLKFFANGSITPSLEVNKSTGAVMVSSPPSGATDVARKQELDLKQNLITLTTTSSPTSFNQALGALNIQPTDLSNYVTLNTAQTISGTKSFAQTNYFENSTTYPVQKIQINPIAVTALSTSSPLSTTLQFNGIQFNYNSFNLRFSAPVLTQNSVVSVQDKPGTMALLSDINAPSISTKTANYTVLLTDYTLVANTTSSAITFTLPTAASAYNASTGTGNVFSFKRNDSGTTNALTIQANGAELIDGTNTKVITSAYGGFTVQSTGTTWIIKM